MFDLKGKVALVAGGAGYLGQPICKALADQGARVIIADIAYERAKSAAEQLAKGFPERKISGMLLDVGDVKSIQEALKEINREWGAVNILVNCAFWGSGKALEEISCEEFNRAMQINLTGSFLLCREAAAEMKKGDCVILFSSMYGKVAPDPRIYIKPMNPNPIEYGVAKAGIIQMVRYMAAYYGPRGIRFNAVAPGPFANPNVQKTNPDFVERLAGKVPLGRIGQSEEVAGAVVFLASNEASYITGHTLSVDGGWTIW